MMKKPVKPATYFLLFISVLISAALLAGCSGGANKELAEAEFRKGLDLADKGDNEQSLIHFEKSVKYDPGNHRAWGGMGTIYRNNKKYDKAFECYEKALKLNPDYTVGLDNLGLTYTLTGKFDKAKESFLKAIEKDPNYANAHFNLAMLFFEKLNDVNPAKEHFQKFLELSDNDAKKKEVEEILANLDKGAAGAGAVEKPAVK